MTNEEIQRASVLIDEIATRGEEIKKLQEEIEDREWALAKIKGEAPELEYKPTTRPNLNTLGLTVFPCGSPSDYSDWEVVFYADEPIGYTYRLYHGMGFSDERFVPRPGASIKLSIFPTDTRLEMHDAIERTVWEYT